MEFHVDAVTGGLLGAALTAFAAALAQTYNWLTRRRGDGMTADERARSALVDGQQALFTHLETRLADTIKRADEAFGRERDARHRMGGLELKIGIVTERAAACERERARDRASAERQRVRDTQLQRALMVHIAKLDGLLEAQGLKVPQLLLPGTGEISVELPDEPGAAK